MNPLFKANENLILDYIKLRIDQLESRISTYQTEIEELKQLLNKL